VAPKEEYHQMLETKSVALCYQGKSCLCHGQNVKKWLYGTKANHVCVADGILEGRVVVPRQIMLMARTQC
jgi:hypothetical protein